MENFRIALIFIALLCLFGCKKAEKAPSFSIENDFETLMGKGQERWQYIQTPEDFQNLTFFHKIYESNVAHLKEIAKEERVPKVLHFIWIGPKPFPRESVENVRTWIAHNPDWKVKFWTDRNRPLPHPAMERHFVKDFHFQKLGALYARSENYGEKSDLLRLEILFQEGGVYADHDVKCLKSFDVLNRSFDFYCGMELPYQTCLSSSVLPTNNLLGSKPGHPIVADSMEWLLANWDQIEQDYPGKDRDSLITRVAHRTFYALGVSFKKCANQEGTRDVALPAYYFNAPNDASAIFARHQYAGKWFEGESNFEKNVSKRLMMLSKKTNKMLLLIGVVGVLNLLGFSFLLIRMLAQPKAQRKQKRAAAHGE